MIGRILAKFSSAVWVIAVKEGEVNVVKGEPPPRFVRECRDVVSSSQIRVGTLTGAQRGGGLITLEFDRGIPQKFHQRFRNLWSQYDAR